MSLPNKLRPRFYLGFDGVQKIVAFVDHLVSGVSFLFIDFNYATGVRGDAPLGCCVNRGAVAVARQNKNVSQSGSRFAIKLDAINLLVAKIPASVHFMFDERGSNLIGAAGDLDLAGRVLLFFLAFRFLTVGLAGDREAGEQRYHGNAGYSLCEV